MKSKFVANDADLIRTVLLDGFSFHAMTSQQGGMLGKLTDLGLVSVITKTYVKCANPKDDDFTFADPECRKTFDLNPNINDEIVRCGYCKREVDLDQKQVFEKYIVHMDVSKAFLYITKRFEQAGFDIGKIKDGWTTFKSEGKSCILCIPSHCTEGKYLGYHYAYSNPILHVYLSHGNTTQNVLPNLKHIFIEDLICRDEVWLRENVELALSNDITLPSAEENEKAFDDLLARISDDEFELFATFVCNQAANSRAAIREYEKLLRRDRDNIHGQFAVRAGDAGNSDGYFFKKSVYLSGLFEAKWEHIEGKKFTSEGSRLDGPRWGGFLENCMEQPGVIFLANNSVTGKVWERVKLFYDREGYAKFAIITKDLLLELIAVLGGRELIRDFLEKGRHVVKKSSK